MLELYTSQGCSSCPPAEHWLQQFTNSPRLWSQIIPIAMHVDYWDDLGWKDPYANLAYTQRQRAYRQAGHVGGVYTPGFVVNGQEWRGWFDQKSLPTLSGSSGILQVTAKNEQLIAEYSGKNEPLVLHAVLLGFGLKTSISRGENRQRVLEEDFVSLAQTTSQSIDNHWQLKIPTSTINAKRYGLAIWVERPNQMSPIQATGGWFTPEP
ncbi:MAG: DUF1223 domain-containing protein [Candidatus Saccharibacteria bacterium]|nr:DUF1223 domain-containing protein [Moraxellaceae bacterium]